MSAEEKLNVVPSGGEVVTAGMLTEHGLVLKDATADEPVFVLRGRDPLAGIAARQYALALEYEKDVSLEKKNAVWKAVMAFTEWQAANKQQIKLPS